MKIHKGVLLATALLAASPSLATSQDERQIALLLQRQVALREQIAQVRLNLLVDSIDQADRGLARRRTRPIIAASDQSSAREVP
jgi:hypothetical protein